MSTLASHADIASHWDGGIGERSPRGPGRRDCGRGGVEPIRREAVSTLRVGDDGDGDGRAHLLGADQHAFHRAFLGRGNLAAERSSGLRLRGNEGHPCQCTYETCRRKQSFELHDRLSGLRVSSKRIASMVAYFGLSQQYPDSVLGPNTRWRLD